MTAAGQSVAAKPPRPSGWPRARGPHYLDVLAQLHADRRPDWYLEIGVGRGNSLARCPGRAVAVDPDFRVSQDVIGSKPELHLIRATSAEFFASDPAAALSGVLDLAFIDGQHLFEYVLDDFIATEKLCHPRSMVLLHDLVPLSPAAADRIWDPALTKGWSGDAWKMTLILREYRPDLVFDVLDTRPSGLGVVTGLDPANRILERARDEIVERFMTMTIESYGPRRLKKKLQMQEACAVLPGLRALEAAE